MKKIHSANLKINRGTISPDKSVKIGEAAKILGLSIKTLRRWESAGKISSTRTPGGTRLYTVDELKKINPSTLNSKRKTQTTEELLKKIEDGKDQILDRINTSELPATLTSYTHPLHHSPKWIINLLIGSGLLTSFILILIASIAGSYLSFPDSTKGFFKNNIASSLLAPFHSLAQDSIAIISPQKAEELGFAADIEPPPVYPIVDTQVASDVLAAVASSRFLEVNSDTQINGSLFVRDQINNLTLEGTPSASTVLISSGDTTLTVTNDAILDQNVSSASSPTFTSLTLSSATNQINSQGFSFTLPSNTTTLVGIDSTQTLTNKSISGSANTLTNIANASLVNSKVTVSTGTNLEGGGDINLGGAITISLKNSPSFSGQVLLDDGDATAPGLAFTDDTNSGLYRIDEDTISLITGGVEGNGITIDANGNLGVGTITPSYKLQVAGTTNVTGATTLSDTLNVLGNSGFGTSTTPSSTLGISGNISVGSGYISSSTPTNGLAVQGNVGIGITTAANNLSIAGNAAIGSGYANIPAPSNGLLVQGNVGIGTSSAGSLLEIGYSAGVVNNRAGGLQVNYGSDMGTTTSGFTDYNLDKPILTLRTPNGLLGANAGIQTALMIEAEAWDFAQNTGIAIEMGRTGQSSRIISYGNNLNGLSSKLQLQTHSGSAGIWNTGIMIDSTGNVGIGITNPNSFLGVGGGVGIGSLYGWKAAPTNGLAVQGNVGIGTTSATTALYVHGRTTVTNNILVENGYSVDIASSTQRVATGYFDTIDATSIAGTVTGGSTSNASWTINSDNATNDTEDMFLTFERGSAAPNASLTWNSTTAGTNAGYFSLNSGLVMTGSITGTNGLNLGSFTNDIVTPTGEHLSLIPGTGGNVGIGTTSPQALFQVNYSNSNPFVVTSGGNVGIGFTSPDRLLQIASNIDITSSLSSLSAAGGSQFAITGTGDSSEKKLIFGFDTTNNYGLIQSATGIGVGNTAPLILNPAGGFVGIGTTTPIQKLSVEADLTGTTAITIRPTGQNRGLFMAWDDTDGSELGYIDTHSRAYPLYIDASNLILQTKSGAGNVGIGTTSPGSQLSVSNNATIGFGGATSIAGPSNGLAVSGNVGVGTTSTGANLDVVGTARLRGNGGSNSGLTVNTDGNVGIGTTNPTSALHVLGSANITGNTTLGDASTDTVSLTGQVNTNLTFVKEVARTIQIDDSTTSNTAGSTLTIKGAAGTGIGTGGAVTITGGGTQTGAFTNTAGAVNINGGSNTADAGVGGAVNINGGSASLGTGGAINITAGSVTSGNSRDGGAVTIRSGGGSPTTGAGGTLSLIGGQGGWNGAGANINVTTGAGGIVEGVSGGLTLATGTTTSGNTGAIILRTGTATGGTAGSISFQTNGANTRMFIDSNGNVGIGTTSPSQRLQVNSTTSAFAVSSTGNVGIGTTHTDKALTIVMADNDGADGFRILNASGSDVFHISSNGTINSSGNGSSFQALTTTFGSDVVGSSGKGFCIVSCSTRGIYDSNGLRIFDSGTIHFDIGASEKMRVNSTGNIGIGLTTTNSQLSVGNNVHIGSLAQGITAPTNGLIVDGNVGIGATTSDNKLDVWGNARITGTLTVDQGTTLSSSILLPDGSASSPALSFTNDTDTGLWRVGADQIALTTAGGSHSGLSINSSGNVGIGATDPSQKFQVNTNTSNPFVITSGGNLGIGFTSPTQKLQVAGAVKVTGAFSAESAAAGYLDYSGGLRLVSKGASGSTKGTFTLTASAFDGSASTNVFTIDAAGAASVALTSGQTATHMFAVNNQGTPAFVVGSGVSTYCTYCVYAGSAIYPGQIGPGIQTTKNFVFDNTNTSVLRFDISSSTKMAFDYDTAGLTLGYAASIVGPSSGLATSGNVGVGTTTTNSSLSVSGNAHIGSIRQGISAPTSGLFVDGNVGIGATTSSNKLDVWGNTRIAGTLAIDSTTTFTGAITTNGITNSSSGIVTKGINSSNALLSLYTGSTAFARQGWNDSGGFITLSSNTSTPSGAGIQARANRTDTVNGNLGGLQWYSSDGATDTQVGSLSFYRGADVTDGMIVLSTASSGTMAEAVRINSSGNLGIGSSNPGAKLHVGANALIGFGEGISAPTLGLAVFGNVGIGTTSPKAPLHTWGDGTNSALFMNGNVGIGTSFAPRAILQIHNPSPVTGMNETLRITGKWNTIGSGSLIRFTNLHNNVANNPNPVEYNLAGIAAVDDTSNWGASLVFSTAPTGSQGGNSLVEAMRIKSDGNIGIGTTAPSARLQVNTNASNPFVVTSGGNVGIGNTTPAASLEITGNLLFSKETARTISVANTTTANTAGAALSIAAAAGNGSGNGGTLTLTAGASGTSGTPGSVTLVGGASNAGGVGGGTVLLQGGNPTSNNNAAAGDIILGNVTRGNGMSAGSIQLIGDNGGTNSSGVGGGITLTGGSPGAQAASSAGGAITITGGSGGGASNTSAAGGAVSIITGDGGSSTGNSGTLTLRTGSITGAGNLAGSILFQIGGATTRMSIDSSGNVGIGASNPTRNKLAVAGSVGIGTSFGYNSIAPANGLAVEGNVGIGTSSATQALDVASTIIRLRANYTTPTLTQDGEFALGSVGTGANDGRVWIQSQGTTFRFSSDANTADYSEFFYQGTSSAESGDIMVVDEESSSPIEDTGRVKKSEAAYQNQILGVVTVHGKGTGYNNPDDTRQNDPLFAEVGLLGHIYTKVSTENGPIQKGDYITSSTVAGLGMKATKPGQVIGKALEDFEESCNPEEGAYCQGKILVLVDPSFADPNNFLASLSLDDEGNLIAPKIKTEKLLLSDDIEYVPTETLLAYESLSTPDNSGTEYTIDVIASLKNLNEAVLGVKEKQATDSATTSDLAAQIASAAAELAETKSKVDSLNLTPPDILLASGSATLATLEVQSEATFSGQLASYDLTVSNSLKSLGNTQLGDTQIAGSLLIDGLMSIENGEEINVIGTLYLQRSTLAQNLDIFNGKLVINSNGDITTSGKVIASEVKTNKLTISNTPLASGSATLAATIGTATLTEGATKVIIGSRDVEDSSKIFITPTTPTDKVLSVTEINDNEGFSVSIPQASVEDITFNWWIVQTE